MSDRYNDPYWHTTSFAISYATDLALGGSQNVEEPEYETQDQIKQYSYV
jgi:hypothetical protein